MNKIFWFLYEHRVFFLFVVLEALGFVMLVNKNDFQRSRFFNYTVTTMAQCHKASAAVSGYFGLREVNDVLAEKNAVLLNRIADLESKLSKMTNDSLVAYGLSEEDHITYIPAKVIYNSVYKIQNYIIIDKGSLDGIESDMGVIAPQGVVGVVQRTSDHFAVVLPLINPDSRVSAKIKRDSQLGSIVWEGNDVSHVRMEEIPRHVNPVLGDSIITSGYSAIFPAGYLIGTIDYAFGDDNDAFCRIDVDLAVDFQSVDYVVVTAMNNKSEFLELKESVTGDDEK